MKKVFLGFGFGAIQAGLFLYEAFRSGNFDRFVVAEVMPDIVKALRHSGGCYQVNVATDCDIEGHQVSGVEILNPADAGDREALIDVVACADEIATALPSVEFYDVDSPGSLVDILRAGFERRIAQRQSRRTLIYTAENHNQAAEILEKRLLVRWGRPPQDLQDLVQCLNTVIGKMSGVVSDENQIAQQRLARVAGKISRCFLVESFNRILISRVRWPDFQRGIKVFEEKDNLLPFEEAKLYGHNATHALLGYLGRLRGYAFMADMRNDRTLLSLGRAAFLEESGRTLCARHRGLDALFTQAGYQAYVDDLLRRMMNPCLRDAVDRVVRDPRRKLGWEDRLVGTMRMALKQQIVPARYARGARAALSMLQETQKEQPAALLESIWAVAQPEEKEQRAIKTLILDSQLG